MTDRRVAHRPSCAAAPQATQRTVSASGNQNATECSGNNVCSSLRNSVRIRCNAASLSASNRSTRIGVVLEARTSPQPSMKSARSPSMVDSRADSNGDSSPVCARATNCATSLRDNTPDTGCGIKLFEREAFLDLPYFDHMHRYLPALMQRAGWRTVSVPVNHRHRTAGVSKYNNLNRALVGIRDLLGVAWLITRSKRTVVQER